ncbi:MAG TPA: DUF4124 domain-containing protein [Thiotrichales bacterium]|nr:DUF4124 domain-containing protein [Thiotrichales bacterium]
MRRLPLLAAAILVLATTAQAGIYKWVDENGQVHYGERPPPGSDYSSVAPPPPPATDTGTGQERIEKTREFLETSRKAREKAKQDAEKARAEAERRRKNCEAARRNLEILTYTTGRRRIYGPDGTPRKMTEDERELRMARARQQIDKYCDKK